MIETPSGVAESDGGPTEPVGLTDPAGLSLTLRQARGRVQKALPRLIPDHQPCWCVVFERAVVEWLRRRSQF
jgi:hypothetical protein